MHRNNSHITQPKVIVQSAVSAEIDHVYTTLMKGGARLKGIVFRGTLAVLVELSSTCCYNKLKSIFWPITISNKNVKSLPSPPIFISLLSLWKNTVSEQWVGL